MATGNYTSTNANGVTYDLIYNGGLFPSYTLDISGPGVTQSGINGIAPGNVLTTNGSSFNLATLLGNNIAVIPPGITGGVNVLVALLGTTTVYVGGNATISSTVSALAGMTVNVDGGTAVAAGGALLGALSGMTVNLDNGGTFSNGSAVIGVLNGTTINFGVNGGTFIANAGGAILNLSGGPTINGFDAAKDQIQFTNLPGQCTSYAITTGSGNQTITLYDTHGSTLAAVTVAGTTLPIGTYTPGMTGPLKIVDAGSGSNWTVTMDPESSVVPCFYAGTFIATPEGEILVENIRPGMTVCLTDGREASVRWAGYREVATRFADPLRVLPIRIKAGALGENLPARDLLLSPDHAIFFGGILVNAGALVNGSSILREENVPQTFPYYHIELAAHDLLLAEGIPAESFIDNIDRMNFHNWDARETPANEIMEMPYPRAKSHRQVLSAIRAKLAERAKLFQAAEAEAA